MRVHVAFVEDAQDHVHDEDGQEHEHGQAWTVSLEGEGLALELAAEPGGTTSAAVCCDEVGGVADGHAGDQVEADGHAGELVEMIDGLRAERGVPLDRRDERDHVARRRRTAM